MTTSPLANSTLLESGRAVAHPGMYSQVMELTKARLSAMVVLTTIVGYVCATQGPVHWLTLLWTTIGTSLAAGCANALNQLCEIHRDARMHRTQDRPLPSGAMKPAVAFVLAMAMGFAGVAMLALLVNLTSAALAFITIVLYAAVYTPMKPRTTLNTLVGAVCGAIPPVIGWVAGGREFDFGAGLLFALLFVWQLPHFFALAWMYREDYARGGFAMLPVRDPSGEATCRAIVLTSLLLVPVTLLMTMMELGGLWFGVFSTAAGLLMAGLGLRLYRDRSDARARHVFLASIVYLPVVLCVLIVDGGAAGRPGPVMRNHVATAR